MSRRDDAPETTQIARQWRLLLTLRRSRRSIDKLAEELNVTTRTIRRDLAVLRSVGFPIECSTRIGAIAGEVYIIGSMDEWLRNDTIPRKLPPGWRDLPT